MSYVAHYDPVLLQKVQAKAQGKHPLTILSFGAGMQSTALALMSCENAMAEKPAHPLVPVYDAVVFCDLGMEPPCVLHQMEFVKNACEKAGILFVILESGMYRHFIENYGRKRVISIPWFTKDSAGRKGKIQRRFCTITYKVEIIAKFLRWELLGYRKGQVTREWDIKAHEMHLGFSAEEKHRCSDSVNKLYKNRFPLVQMGLVRADNYAYIRDVWGLETKASACSFCPYHTNFFYQYLKEKEQPHYQQLLEMDDLMGACKPHPAMDATLYMSKSFKRLRDLTPAECCDAKYFPYKGCMIWDGF